MKKTLARLLRHAANRLDPAPSPPLFTYRTSAGVISVGSPYQYTASPIATPLDIKWVQRAP